MNSVGSGWRFFFVAMERDDFTVMETVTGEGA